MLQQLNIISRFLLFSHCITLDLYVHPVPWALHQTESCLLCRDSVHAIDMQNIGGSATAQAGGPHIAHPPASAQALSGTPRGSAGQLQGQVPFGLQQQQQQQVMLQRQYVLQQQQQQLLMQQQVHKTLPLCCWTTGLFKYVTCWYLPCWVLAKGCLQVSPHSCSEGFLFDCSAHCPVSTKQPELYSR